MNKIYRNILLLVSAGVIAGGCTKNFEEYNTNPYEPEALPVTSFFPAMLDCLASPEENPCQRNNTFWACFGGYVTAPNSWSRGTLYSTMNVDDDWNKWTVDWYFTAEGGKGLYPGWFSVQRQTDGEGYYFQMAQLLRVYVMSMVASLQGPLPYTSVANGDFYVAYDDEQTAWHAMFDDLDAAIAEIQAAAVSGSTPLSSVDRVYGGDNSKWVKFANTLKLRMAMRISSVDPVYAQQKAEEAVAAGVMESIDDSAYDNLNGRYPNGYYQVSAGWGSYEVKANACIVAYMNGYQDPRRAAYFTRYEASDDAPEEYIGVRSGIQGCIPSDYRYYSGLIYESLDRTTPMPIMFAAEAAFLRAEGALKGWNMGGTAQQFYEQGIRLSFAEWGVEGADAYIANNTLTPGNHTDPLVGENNVTNKSKVTIAWDEGASDDQKLEKIITQKWIAGFPSSLEGWSDFRRTGYPYLFAPRNNLSQPQIDGERQQRRLRFSQSEYERNAANVEAAAAKLEGGDEDGTELWWALKNGEKKY